MTTTDNYRRFEHVDSVEQTPTGLLGQTHGEMLRIDLVREDLLRVTISRGGVFDETPTYAVCVDPLEQVPEFSVDREEGVVRLRTAAMVVSLWLDPLRLDVHRSDGSTVVETAHDEEGRYWAYATLNDAFTFRRTCRPEDAIFGLGEKTGHQNRKGRDFTLWNNDVLNPDSAAGFTAGLADDDPRADRKSTEFDPYYVSIPFFHHQAGPAGAMAASFVDNSYRAAYEFSHPRSTGSTSTAASTPSTSSRGPPCPTSWRRTPGSPVAPHRRRCGPWATTSVAGRTTPRTRSRHSRSGTGTRRSPVTRCGWTSSTWTATASSPGTPTSSRTRPGMLKRLSANGFRVITIIDPGVKHEPGYWVYDQAVERGVLCRTEGGDTYIGQVWPGNTAFPDFATEEARAWWGELNADHVRSGLAGIWNDMNEPATGNIDPRAMRFNHGRDSHERYHNQYALLMAMGTTQGLREAMPDQRTFVLSRAGFAGIQRYAANWMGDNQSRWDHLWLSIPMGTGLGLSGQAFVGADIGGFAGNSNAELFLRWMQYGALTPFCRNHSEIGNVDQYAWAWGDLVQSLVREALRLRYRLMPYLYAAFLTASETGAPVQRPLVFDHQEDPLVRDLDDQYLFGRDLLVAPVLQPGRRPGRCTCPKGTGTTGIPVRGSTGARS